MVGAAKVRRWGVRSVGALYLAWGAFAIWTAFTQAGNASDMEVIAAGLLGVAYAVVGIEIALIRPWGFYGAIVLLLAALLLNVYQMWTDPTGETIASALLRSGLQAIPVLYLLRPSVRLLFSERS